MTATNIFGPSVGRGHVRKWIYEGLRLYMPDYLREAERSQGYPVGQAQLPRSYPVAPDLRKMPEAAIPAIVIGLPGIAADPDRGARGVYSATWLMALTALVHGANMEDTEALADVYGLALSLLMVKQAGDFTSPPGYAGPDLDVQGVTWLDVSYDDLPWSRSRTLVAATLTVRVDIRGVLQTGGLTEPSADPTLDPGAWPEVLTTELQVNRRA
jgi:hypothetical protein